MRLPFILLVVFPFIELVILLQVADEIGGWSTVLIIVLTAALGVLLLRRRGFNTLQRFQARMQSGEMPAQEIVDGMLISFSGLMLLAPGLITDSIGIVCLLPPVRRRIAQRILRSGSFFMAGSFQGGFHGSPFEARQPPHGDTIDGEYRDETHPDPALPDERHRDHSQD